MIKRILLGLMVTAILLPSVGCCWRRGCNKCNTANACPAPAPAYYVPPSCP